MKRYVLILALITFSLTGLSSCYVENEAYPQTYYMGHPHLRHHVNDGNWHDRMGGGYHGGLNNEQHGAHPRHSNGSGY